MASDKEKTRIDAHKALDFVMDEIIRMRQCSEVIVKFNCIQGGIRNTSIQFGLSNFTGLAEVPRDLQ